MTLTGLLMTRLETGPVSAVRMARALPPGNWAMVAFLATFTQTAPTIGLCGKRCAGLRRGPDLPGHGRPPDPAPTPLAPLRGRFLARSEVPIRPDWRETVPPGPAWPRTPRRFSPLVEPFAA